MLEERNPRLRSLPGSVRCFTPLQIKRPYLSELSLNKCNNFYHRVKSTSITSGVMKIFVQNNWRTWKNLHICTWLFAGLISDGKCRTKIPNFNGSMIMISSLYTNTKNEVLNDKNGLLFRKCFLGCEYFYTLDVCVLYRGYRFKV